LTQNQLIELIESEQVKALVERSEERGFIEPAEFEAFVLEHDLNDDEQEQLTRELDSNGHYLDASPLHPVSTATSVRVREGKRLVTDGPFAETREQLGGYFLVNAKDLDEAISIAAKIPGARLGTVEIRPVMEIAGLPEES